MLLRQYAEQMTAYYKYAQKLGLEVVICLPYWYDKDYAAPLEQLIGQACDQAAIMNYNRHDEAGQLAKEAEYAQRYHKTLIHIYEFIAPGKHGLESGNTYHDASLDAANPGPDFRNNSRRIRFIQVIITQKCSGF
ncbi:MAG: hypothetical protein ACLSFJ_03765 [Holdemania filiformis]